MFIRQETADVSRACDDDKLIQARKDKEAILKEEIEYDMIYTYHISQLVKVYKRFEQNYQKRENYISESIEKKKSEKIALHGIPSREPLFSLFETSNGFK